MNSDTPGAAFVQLFSERDIQVSKQSWLNTCLCHRLFLDWIESFFGKDGGDLAVALFRDHCAFIGNVVVNRASVDTVKFKYQTAEFVRITWRHAYVLLLLIQTDHGNANDKHRDSKMCDRHAPDASRLVCQCPKFVALILDPVIQPKNCGKCRPQGQTQPHRGQPLIRAVRQQRQSQSGCDA